MARQTRFLFRRRGHHYLLRLKQSDVDATLLFLLFWFLWRQRHPLTRLFEELFEALGG